MDNFLLKPLFEKKTVKMDAKTYKMYEKFKESKKVIKEDTEDVEDKYGLDNVEGIKFSDSFSETGYEEIDSEDYNEDPEEFEFGGNLEDEEEGIDDARYQEIKSDMEELVHLNIEGEKINEEDKKELIKQYAKSLIDLTDDCHGNEALWSAMVDKMTDEIYEGL